MTTGPVAAEVRVGISGRTYAGWRGDFYPCGLPHREELAYVGARLGSVEINGSFCSLQRRTSYESWHDQTPDDFVFGVKGALDAWAARIRQWAVRADVVVYFDNDAQGFAPYDAERLRARLG